MRIVKEAKERRNEILDVAEKLFSTKGYDSTSTNDILAEIGIARGTLYYHFKSKEDILDALVERMTGKLLQKASQIAQNKSVPILERLTRTIVSMHISSDIGIEVTSQLHKPQNALMHQKLQTELIEGTVPILTELIAEGIGDGIMQTDYPKQAVEMLMVYSSEIFDGVHEQTPHDRQKRIEGFIYNAERLLGMERGMLQAPLMSIFEN